MIADTKKCQTLINKAATAAEKLQEITTDLQNLRGLYQSQNVNPSGTILSGNISILNTWIDDISDVANNNITETLIDNYVPTHSNQSLKEN